MKIVVAMDSFKGSLSAESACACVRDGLAEAIPQATYEIIPLADGGEGTARAVMSALDGEWTDAPVMGPLPSMQVDAGFAWFNSTNTALIEMASASGMPLLGPEQLNPMLTTTYGTGQLINHAIERGAKQILLAVGGSATVDGGTGAAAALGWRFLDGRGMPVVLGGRGLAAIEAIERPHRPKLPPMQVLCDVGNPLTGANGAARVYGPQKGADAEMVEQLDAALKRLANLVRSELGLEMDALRGAGAAGGLAGGAAAFFGAELSPGIDTVLDFLDFGRRIAAADWVVTGEGSFDRQSLEGKVVDGVARAAKKAQARVAVLAGSVSLAPSEYRKAGITNALAVTGDRVSVEESLAHPEYHLKQTARNLGEIICLF